MEIIINFKIKNLTKNSKSRKYIYSHKISRKALHHFTASQIQRWSLPSLILLHWRLSNSFSLRAISALCLPSKG